MTSPVLHPGRLLRFLALLGACLLAPVATARTGPPNVVIIYADDLGYGDLGCYGHPTIRTPHLDRMAAEGLRFTSFYTAAEVCTPSRAALLTGRYPVRSGMCDDQRRVLFPDSAGGLPSDEVTLPELLRTRGYATGMVGKWHLGHLPEFLPTRHGFDQFFGLPYSNDMDRSPDSPPGRRAFLEPRSEYWKVPLIRDDRTIEKGPDQSQLTRRYTEEAVRFIREKRERPFFLYFAHTFPHVPLFASDRFLGRSPRGLYGDAVEELDWSVGEVLAALREAGLEKDTLVWFSSDNGPWLTQREQGGSAGGLRDGKGSTWEGGMRVPGIAWWPGRIAAGRVTDDPAATLDLLPTVAALANAPLPGDRTIDGVDLAPLIFGTGPGPRSEFAFYRGATLHAFRKGPYKAHFTTRTGYGGQPTTHTPPVLFHLGVDPGESYNVAGQHPEILAEINEAVARHRMGIEPVPSQLTRRIVPATGP